MNRNEKVFKKLKEHLNYLKDNYPNYNVIYIALQGSQNYNLDMYTDEYTSDVDTKAILVPSLEEIALNQKPVSTTLILPDNSHCDCKDIRLMMQNFKKLNINFIEILFTKFKIINPKYKDLILQLIDKREEIAHMNFNQSLRCMSGMSMQKRKALTHPYEGLKDKIEKYGYDGKQLHHIIRMNFFIKAFASHKTFEECLTYCEDKQLVMDAKLSKFSLVRALELADTYDEETHLIMKTNLKEQDTCNIETSKFMDELQYEIIKRALQLELDTKQEKFNYNTIEQKYKNIFVTSDIHFFHSNIIKYEENRCTLLPQTPSQYVVKRTTIDCKEKNIDEQVQLYLEEYYKEMAYVMNEEIVKLWNKTVKANDLVFILGDIALNYKNINDVNEVISKLNGDKILILGNHDYPILQDKGFNTTLFKDIADYKTFNLYGKSISMFHYPIASFFKQDKNGILLYGHIHSSKLEKEIPSSYNVGMDVNNYKPVNIKEFISFDNRLKDVIREREELNR